MKNTTIYHTKHKDTKRDQQTLLDYICPRQTISKASKRTDVANFVLENESPCFLGWQGFPESMQLDQVFITNCFNEVGMKHVEIFVTVPPQVCLISEMKTNTLPGITLTL
jgi:hypothetical protein